MNMYDIEHLDVNENVPMDKLEKMKKADLLDYIETLHKEKEILAEEVGSLNQIILEIEGENESTLEKFDLYTLNRVHNAIDFFINDVTKDSFTYALKDLDYACLDLKNILRQF